MSYNIDDASYIPGTGPLRMRPSAARRAVKAIRDRPKSNFVDGIDRDVDDDEPQAFRSPNWTGEGSGNTFSEYLRVLAMTEGSADILLTWEGGDSMSGLRVRDGVVTQHKIVVSLGERTP